MSSVLVYGQINCNIIDGSSTWLISVCEVLDKVFDDVYFLPQSPIENDRLTSRLEHCQNVHILSNSTNNLVPDRPLSAEEGVQCIDLLVENLSLDVVIIRGFEACFYAARVNRVAIRLWSYVTDLPYPITKISRNNLGRLKKIAVNSRRIFSQTDATRSYLEEIVPEAAGKTLIMRPMVPDAAYQLNGPDFSALDKIRIIYAGKIAKDWKVEELIDLPKFLKARGIASELLIVGDKIQKTKSDRQFVPRMRAKLEAAHEDEESGVTWLGGVPRDEVFELISQSHIGIGWRTSALDSSTEVSTKLLEYCAIGIIPVVNRTADHELSLGSDYPFFSLPSDDAEQLADIIAKGLPAAESASSRLAEVSKSYSMSAAEERFRSYFTSAGVLGRTGLENIGLSKITKVAIVSHDFKFLGELMHGLEGDPSFDVRTDVWENLRTHDIPRGHELIRWADTVFCEWAGPSVVWYSRNKRPGTRLITRLHGFEIRGPWLKDIDFSRVDLVVFVSEFYRQKCIALLGLDPDRTVVIPNSIDLDDFDRPKLPGSEFRIGMLGYVGFGKRPDRALETLKILLESDSRFSLHFKGQPPWNYAHEWNNPIQAQLYLEFFNEIASSPDLRDRVSFEPFGPAVATWFRKIGFILSPSHNESFHLAVAEGMASRAYPVVWEREGSKEIFSEKYVVEDARVAASRILEQVSSGKYVERCSLAREYATRWDHPIVFKQWVQAFSAR